ncbi:hypothetical protein FHS00_000442 [Limimaricola variabilis]|jgi:hypothetical protein|uniref:DUF1476 domain-containing protein n=1 Tax=Limimaricola variabilis TaxID=1492771 RepID=A0ABR6HK12_9RHOB|nr:DUF1476 domain-containing protein [Limimaricola variabilis]MBB3710889.1 hypothetical protein [Limimaricola variabilis]WPY95443.1 DUF1476 domain-containing protein [Limimaricola variabilis]
MTLFEEREHAFEAKFAHDAEMKFRAEARRNRKLGFWAAGLLGKEGDEAAAYAKEVIKADFEEAGTDDVFRKLRRDIGHLLSDEEIRDRMTEYDAEAKAELVKES